MLVHAFVTARRDDARIPSKELRFTRKELRDATGWTDFQVQDHLAKLVDLEYLLVHRGRQGRQFVYELLWNGEG